MSATPAPQPDLFDETFLAVSAPRLPLDRWAEERRIVVGGARPGPWNPRYAPMALEPMRAVTDERVRVVALVAPSQLLKTELAINSALQAVDYGDDCLFYEPDLPLIEEMIGERIRPALRALGEVQSTGLEAALRKKRDSRFELRLRGGGAIKGATPQMKTGLSARSARLVVIDELDKMARSDMMVVARERTTTFGRDAKIVVVSTPTVDALGTVWREWSGGSRGEWRGRCPHCREHVTLDWREAAVLDQDDDGLWLPETARLVCQSCGVVWSESDRLAAVNAGCYVHDEPEHEVRTFRVPGPAHLWRSLREIAEVGAAAYRAAMTEHDWAAYIAWWNGMVARPWEDEFKGLSARGLEGTTFVPGPRGQSDLGELDDRVLVVTAGVDVGAHHIKAEFVGWGIDAETDRVRSWGLRYVVLGDNPEDSIDEPDLWDALDREVRESVWRRPGGGRVRAARVLIDEGHRPELVRKWATARYRASGPRTLEFFGAQVCPARGHNREIEGYPVNLEIGTRPKKGRPVPVPATVYVMTNPLKTLMWDWMEADRRLPPRAERAHQYPEGGAAHGYTSAYFKEMAAEMKDPYRTPQGKPATRWVQRHGWTRHDAWDCRILALAGLHVQAYPGVLSDYLGRRRRVLASRLRSVK